ncbi:MAG TPA: ArsR family transcriptional regulator [Desulfobacteraceae bacterium]|nr:ArsR family transcriptional regulator [Desulfobacteraceae bacterium]
MEKTINITKALADGNRLRVINALMDQNELCVCQITEMLGHSTPTVSRHMSVLQNAALVRSRKEGRWVYYRLSETFPPILLQWLKDAMGNAEEIIRDKEKLEGVFSCGVEALCRTQRLRRNCRAALKKKKESTK